MIEAVNWHRAVIAENATFQQAFQNLNDVAIKLCICASEDGTLIGLITDGDLRRGLLRGLSMDDSVSDVINRNPFRVRKVLVVDDRLPHLFDEAGGVRKQKQRLAARTRWL